MYSYKVGTRSSVLINQVSLFQGKNNMYLYKVGTRTSVLINQVSLLGSTVVSTGLQFPNSHVCLRFPCS